MKNAQDAETSTFRGPVKPLQDIVSLEFARCRMEQDLSSLPFDLDGCHVTVTTCNFQIVLASCKFFLADNSQKTQRACGQLARIDGRIMYNVSLSIGKYLLYGCMKPRQYIF